MQWPRLLLGQVNAFTIDIQKQVIQPRAHIAEFFVGDDWKVSQRLTLNIGTRYTLNFPSTEVNNQGAVFNLQTQVLDFPHTAREVHWGDFGPRVGLAYRIGDNWVIRSGYGMIFFEQSGITTPFTIPQFPFIQTLGQQSPDNVNAAFRLSNGPTVQVTDSESELRIGARRVRRRSRQWLGLFAAMELHGSKDASERTGTWRWRTSARRIRGSAYPTQTSTSFPRNICRWARRC